MDFDDRLERLIRDGQWLLARLRELHAITKQHTEEIKQGNDSRRQDGERIRALLRLAEHRERRLTGLEGGEAQA